MHLHTHTLYVGIDIVRNRYLKRHSGGLIGVMENFIVEDRYPRRPEGLSDGHSFIIWQMCRKHGRQYRFGVYRAGVPRYRHSIFKWRVISIPNSKITFRFVVIGGFRRNGAAASQTAVAITAKKIRQSSDDL